MWLAIATLLRQYYKSIRRDTKFPLKFWIILAVPLILYLIGSNLIFSTPADTPYKVLHVSVDISEGIENHIHIEPLLCTMILLLLRPDPSLILLFWLESISQTSLSEIGIEPNMASFSHAGHFLITLLLFK
jgi:hypothetical protein